MRYAETAGTWGNNDETAKPLFLGQKNFVVAASIRAAQRRHSRCNITTKSEDS
jgi:hypothetical protein